MKCSARFFDFEKMQSEQKPKSEMTEEELQALEEAEFQTGPLSLLTQAVKNHTQILISCRNNRKLFARVKALYPLLN
jgi:small nuclear ribonucleoprotein D2